MKITLELGEINERLKKSLSEDGFAVTDQFVWGSSPEGIEIPVVEIEVSRASSANLSDTPKISPETSLILKALHKYFKEGLEPAIQELGSTLPEAVKSTLAEDFEDIRDRLYSLDFAPETEAETEEELAPVASPKPSRTKRGRKGKGPRKTENSTKVSAEVFPEAEERTRRLEQLRKESAEELVNKKRPRYPGEYEGEV